MSVAPLPVPANGGAPDIARAGMLEQLSRLRTELDRVVSIEEIQEATSRLRGVEAYANAKGAKDITDQAAETRIWCERRAGEIAKESPVPLKKIAETYDVQTSVVGRWLMFAAAPKELVVQYIDEIRKSRDLSPDKLYHKLSQHEEQTTKDGITRLLDGRFRLRWESHGVRHSHHCRRGATLKEASGTMQRLKRANQTALRHKRNPSGLSVVYSVVRDALARLDATLPSLPDDSREVAEKAMASLYTAEDLVVQARKLDV